HFVIVFRLGSAHHDDDSVAREFCGERGAARGVFGLRDLRECRRGGEGKQREEPCEFHARLECGLCAGSVMRSLPESCQPVAVRWQRSVDTVRLISLYQRWPCCRRRKVSSWSPPSCVQIHSAALRQWRSFSPCWPPQLRLRSPVPRSRRRRSSSATTSATTTGFRTTR